MPPEQNPENLSDKNGQGKKKLVLSPGQLETLEALLSQLRPLEAMTLRFLYGFEDGYFHTLEEVAHVFGVARERIRQLEGRAFTKLGENSRYFSQLEYLSDENLLETKSDDITRETPTDLV